MPRMQMVLGQNNNIPSYIVAKAYTHASRNAPTTTKGANITSLRFSMIERISSARPSCGSCGKK